MTKVAIDEVYSAKTGFGVIEGVTLLASAVVPRCRKIGLLPQASRLWNCRMYLNLSKQCPNEGFLLKYKTGSTYLLHGELLREQRQLIMQASNVLV